MGTITENDLRITRIVLFPTPAPGMIAVSLETLLIDGTVHRTFDREVTSLLSGALKTQAQSFVAALEAEARTILNIPKP